MFLWIGPLFRRIGPRVSQDRTFSKNQRSHSKETPCILQATLASGTSTGPSSPLANTASSQSVRTGCAVFATATVAAAVATGATACRGDEDRKFTTAERQALGCQCVASCYHYGQYSPRPCRFPENERAGGEEGILRRVVSISFLESTEVWDVALFQDTKHWAHDQLRWMGDGIVPFYKQQSEPAKLSPRATSLIRPCHTGPLQSKGGHEGIRTTLPGRRDYLPRRTSSAGELVRPALVAPYHPAAVGSNALGDAQSR